MSEVWAFALFAVAGFVFFLPLLPAVVELQRRRDVAPLNIEQAHDGDARYFAERCRAVVEAALACPIQRNELVVLAAGSTAALDRGRTTGGSVGAVVVASDDCELPGDVVFDHEVFGQADLVGGAGNRYRAVYADGDLRLGANSTVLRWADASHMQISQGALLLGRTTARKSIELHAPARFSRMNAPVICCGAARDMPPAAAASPLPAFSREVVHGDYATLPAERVSGSVVATGFAHLLEDTHVNGSIKGCTGVRVETGVHVAGSVVSGDCAVIHGPCRIVGPLIAEHTVWIGPGVVIGSPEKPTTVTAAVIRIASGARLHGTVWAKHEGWVEA